MKTIKRKTIKRKNIKCWQHLAYISLRAGPLRHLHLTQSKTITHISLRAGPLRHLHLTQSKTITHVSLSQNKTTQCSHPHSRTTRPLLGPEPSRHLHLTQSKTITHISLRAIPSRHLHLTQSKPITHISLSQSKTSHGATPHCLLLMGGRERGGHCLPLLRSPRRSLTGSREEGEEEEAGDGRGAAAVARGRWLTLATLGLCRHRCRSWGPWEAPEVYVGQARATLALAPTRERRRCPRC